jgi:N-terminal acetyltransferase B complex non-catalytic subunit
MILRVELPGLLQIYTLTAQTLAAVQTIVVLEAACALRPYSASIRLALAGLHELVANPVAALEHFQALSIRQVQLDSLGHHVLPTLTTFNPAPSARFMLEVRPIC